MLIRELAEGQAYQAIRLEKMCRFDSISPILQQTFTFVFKMNPQHKFIKTHTQLSLKCKTGGGRPRHSLGTLTGARKKLIKENLRT